MAIILTYDNLEGRATRDTLRRLSTRDMDKLREEVDLYWKVMEKQNDPEYTLIWNTPTRAMPWRTIVAGKKYRLQSPREYLEGFMEKINRQRGTDLSPKQCEGVVNFNIWFSEEFGTDKIIFIERDELLAADPAVLKQLEDL